MYRLNSNNTSYTIPLDSLDLNYLRRQFDNGSTTPMPLWRVPSGEDHYEFKLNAWRILESDDEEDEADNISSESSLCHVCNIYVPIIYINNHNRSEKHINMKKILDLMVVRGRNPDLVHPSRTQKSTSCYYCENCSLIVPINNRQSHEKSYTHKKSIRNENLIEEFLRFYSEDLSEEMNITMKTMPLQDYFNKYFNRKNLSFKISVINEDLLTIIVKTSRLKIKNNNFHGFVETENELICILCETRVTRVLTLIEQHIESKKHRKKVTRHIDDRHCIREFNDDFAHCILCNELVLLTRVAGHKLLAYHTSNLNIAQGRKNSCDFNKNLIFSEGIEENSFGKYLRDELDANESVLSEDCTEICEEDDSRSNLRTVDIENDVYHDTSVLYRTSSYISTDNFDNHSYKQLQSTQNDIEKGHERIHIKTININDEIAETKRKLCELVKIHLSEVGNKNKEKTVPIDNATVQEPIIDDDIKELDTEPIEIPTDFVENINYLLFETIVEKEIICEVCNVLMSNSDFDIYEHFNGDDHTKKYNELLKANRITKAQNKFFCYSCKASITSKNELEHIFGIKHRNKFPNVIEDRIYCVFCKVYISDTVQDHQNSEEHLKACLSHGNNVETKITEDIKSLDDANDDDEISDLSAERKIVTPVPITGNVFLKIHYHLVKTADIHEVLCKICDLTIPNSLVAIDTHIEGFYHTNKYKHLLESNRIEKDGNRFHCKICDVFVTVKNEIEHIAGVKHRSNLYEYVVTHNDDETALDDTGDEASDDEIDHSESDQTPASVTESDDLVQTSIEGIDDISSQTDDELNAEASNVSTAKTESDVNIPQHYHVAKTNNSEMLCKVCDVLIANSAVEFDAHIQGFSHSDKYEKLLLSNKIVTAGHRFACYICHVYIGNKNELDHIRGSKHKNKLKLSRSFRHCDKCDIDVPATEMQRHLQSMEHFNVCVNKIIDDLRFN